MNTNISTAASKTYTIVRNPEGERGVKLSNGKVIPCDIAALCTGKDAWLAAIEVKCRDCNQLFPLRALQGNGQWCDECQSKSIEG